MTFIAAQRISRIAGAGGRSMLGAGHRVSNRLRASRYPTPQERANHYVSRMPIAVVTASLGGHP
ncbi:hypothetical protein MB901379_00233 [Mycobacterium basiliense]|uniref:Uncharacterized protein n=1 Tax=Mycobacterium basiliense TaxID=2094119 RepID=A0A447G863_9MYCO|nr:hypothetical protein [Mycobacterium basiliense]VDM86708.1 hypothetical protein MB901379_00233 [Mycobacterium basiliense]